MASSVWISNSTSAFSDHHFSYNGTAFRPSDALPAGGPPTSLYARNITPNGTSGPLGYDHVHTSWSHLETVIFAAWLIISMLFTIVGNFMVIAVVWRHRGMRTRTNMFIVNLAIADFLIGILLAPFSLTTLIAHDWILGDALCFLNSFLNAVCFLTSLQTLMYISIHKYLSITRPLIRITKCKILIMIMAAWLWGIICASLTTFILSHYEYKEKTMQCGPAYPGNTVQSYIFHFIIQISNLYLPLGIMLFCYIRIFQEIKKHMQRMDENSAMDRKQIFSQQRRVTVTLFIVLACFVLCWLPYCVYANYVTFVTDKQSIPAWANGVAYCAGYMNSACNPIIYAWRSPSFREGYKEILCQEPSYIVSDDTMHDSSPGPRRRISLFINSMRASQRGSRMGSDDSLSHYSLHSLNKAHKTHKTNDSSTHKLLRKLTGKTAKGSSVIKRDGSVILVKNGKIVSMREDVRRRNTSGDLDDVFLPNSSPIVEKYKNGTRPPLTRQPNLNVLYENSSERVELGDLKENGTAHALMCRSISEEDLKSSYKRSVDKVNSSSQNIEILISEAPNLEHNQLEKECPHCKRLSTFKPLENRCVHGMFLSSPNAIKRSRSDTIRISSDNQSEETMQLLSKSDQNVYKLPLLKSPSLERLKMHAQMNGTASDSEINVTVPLYTRRWLKNNSASQQT
uniref:Neuropeptide Y receptor type 4-like isoform X3 n=1 Tax=Crassostrea virginica TaxID=6565 RepID=A0A8B8BJN3_CRAVI|nr:neuropeptide Y receptor type 4-like isoform X3 [Crassostrea virginica]